MHNETLLPVTWRTKPRGFVALMSLYESNYLRLVRLCGDPARLQGEVVSRVPRGCDLRLRVLERAAYTVTLNLTHLFDQLPPVATAADDSPLLSYPDVRVRAYCDARLVQAQHWADGPQAMGPARTTSEREMHQRWVFNSMLNKWLEYCLDLGHRLV
ncbi:MAG: DUF1249 domain-containing protein [Pseudomonadota bacterium]